MGWREYAKQVQQARHDRHDRHETPEMASIVPNVPIVLEVAPANPARVLRYWHSKLSALDDCTAPDGWSLGRWQQLCDDACWIYEGFASRAVRDGWTAIDLFGVTPTCGEGGLADRLQGARNLKMSEGQAVWSRFGVPQPFGRGVLPPEMRPFWELASHDSSALAG